MTETLPTPVGMVDTLPPTPRPRSPFQIATVKFVIGTGAPDPAIVAQLMDANARIALAEAETEQRERDWPNLGLYRSENNRLRAAAERPRVVFMGDSITELWPFGDPGLFAGGVVGRGISGQTSPQMLSRFYADAISLRPQAVHILAGCNDIAGNTGPTTPQDYKNNISAMLDICQANGVRVLLASILPCSGMGWRPEVKPAPRIAELNAWLRETARRRSAVWVDYFTATVAQDSVSLRADFANDGVHPNAAGYAAMRPVIDAALKQLFAGPGA